MKTSHSRLTIQGTPDTEDRADFEQDVRQGLLRSSKRLSCRHIYDRVGSELFAQICRQPEYYLTRAERQILQRRAAEIVEDLDPQTVVVELGSGTSEKTRVFIEAFVECHGGVHYVPIDISVDALESAAEDMLQDVDAVQVTAFAGEYRAGLEFVSESFDGPMCVLWLGSSVGNFDRDMPGDFLVQIQNMMARQDCLIMGVDLRKDREILEAAYDDAAGVTASFNRNILVRLNEELGADFDLDQFRYEARYSDARGRVEMFQVSRVDQEVHIADLDLNLRFSAGEAIHTENSHKYSPEEIDELARSSGFTVQQRWLDGQRRFSLNFLVPL